VKRWRSCAIRTCAGKSRTEAPRAVACIVAAASDLAHCHPDKTVRRKNQAFAELMIPVVKG
jgi:3-(methylthio)propanoyl-CoA dehydrogenase